MGLTAQQARTMLDVALLEDTFSPPEPTPELLSERKLAPQQTVAVVATSTEPSVDASTAADDESWKEEYESQVRVWRAQSAEQREKAEKERLRWETIRAREKEQADRENSIASLSTQESWEQVAGSGAASTGSTLQDLPRTQFATQGGTPEDINKWEHLPSVASSFPSLPGDTTLEPSQPSNPPPPPPRKGPASVTLSIFNSSLSTRTRVLAFASALAMNLVLPFVNGVMLGFGEIFARHAVTQWFGWKIPAVHVGLRSNPLRR